MDQGEKINNYSDFWVFYLKEHSKPLTRRLHVVGTSLGMVVAVILALTGNWAYLPLCLVIGYGFAWYSHFFIEKNRPATFRYPWWSFISDFRLIYWAMSGRMRV